MQPLTPTAMPHRPIDNPALSDVETRVTTWPQACRSRRRRLAVALVTMLSIGASLSGGEGDLLLPDIVVSESELLDHDVVNGEEPGTRILRLTNGTANVGEGPLYLRGVLPPVSPGQQSIVQRVFLSGGEFIEREAGEFVYHEDHGHIHFENWSRYRLRSRLEDDGIGEVVAESEKVSFCIVDLSSFDLSLPNAMRTPLFSSCGAVIQGLSVGWIDIYSKTLEGQNIDITDVPDGFYWLESEVDPENNVWELDEENNVARIQVTIGNPPRAPDPYEPNDTLERVAGLLPGIPNSANLGPCNPKRVIENLNLHEVGDIDHFRFYVNDIGTARTLVRVDFEHARGDVDLTLLHDEIGEVGKSSTEADHETIPLEGLPPGWYTARVSAKEGHLSPDYRFTVVPPQNAPPRIEVLTPPAGDTQRLHAADSFVVEWSHFDPDGGESWVTVYVAPSPKLDGREEVLSTARFVPGDVGIGVINSAEIPEGTYWVYCEITDGGHTVGDWSEGTVSFVEMDEECHVEPGVEDDCNMNFLSDACELDLGLLLDCDLDGVPDECEVSVGTGRDDNANGVLDACEKTPFQRGDFTADGLVDVSDATALFTFLFLGTSRPSCQEAADADNDNRIAITDGIFTLDYLFLGGDSPPEPGSPLTPCGVDPDPLGSSGDLGCESYSRC